jgi:hypothetical protein
MGTLHENLYKFLIVSRLNLLRMRNVSDKVVEKIKTKILSSTIFFFPKIVSFLNNVEKYCYPERPQMTIWRMRIPKLDT